MLWDSGWGSALPGWPVGLVTGCWSPDLKQWEVLGSLGSPLKRALSLALGGCYGTLGVQGRAQRPSKHAVCQLILSPCTGPWALKPKSLPEEEEQSGWGCPNCLQSQRCGLRLAQPWSWCPKGVGGWWSPCQLSIRGLPRWTEGSCSKRVQGARVQMAHGERQSSVTGGGRWSMEVEPQSRGELSEHTAFLRHLETV